MLPVVERGKMLLLGIKGIYLVRFQNSVHNLSGRILTPLKLIQAARVERSVSARTSNTFTVHKIK